MRQRKEPLRARANLAGRAQSEVLQGAVEGEPWANAALYDVLYPTVARALRKVLRQDDEDLVQTCFESIVRTLKKPRAQEIKNLAGLSSTIAERIAVDSLRFRIRERRIFDRDEDVARAAEHAPGKRLEHELDVRRDLLWLQGALAAMKPDQAQTVVLRDVLGHELWEVAQLTDASLHTVQKRLVRGHLALKTQAKRRAR